MQSTMSGRGQTVYDLSKGLTKNEFDEKPVMFLNKNDVSSKAYLQTSFTITNFALRTLLYVITPPAPRKKDLDPTDLRNYDVLDEILLDKGETVIVANQFTELEFVISCEYNDIEGKAINRTAPTIFVTDPAFKKLILNDPPRIKGSVQQLGPIPTVIPLKIESEEFKVINESRRKIQYVCYGVENSSLKGGSSEVESQCNSVPVKRLERLYLGRNFINGRGAEAEYNDIALNCPRLVWICYPIESQDECHGLVAKNSEIAAYEGCCTLDIGKGLFTFKSTNCETVNDFAVYALQDIDVDFSRNREVYRL